MYFLYYLVLGLILIVCLLINIAFYTVAERKVMGSIQRRKGPNVVGFFGMLQPLVDGAKLIWKEIIIPGQASNFIFLFAPALTFSLSLVNWSLIPFNTSFVLSDSNLGVLIIFSISALSIYGIILAGWASNSKYAFLGALRSAAQMISYEVCISVILIIVLFCANSFNLTEIVLIQQNNWFLVPLFPIFVVFLISMLAETNRVPFDLPEAEAEIVAGYNVEYSAIPFALFFLGEYSNMLIMSALTVIFFLGGWFVPFSTSSGSSVFILKLLVVAFFFIWVRSTLPRYRYDQLMVLGWKYLMPFTFFYLIFLIYYACQLGFYPKWFDNYVYINLGWAK